MTRIVSAIVVALGVLGQGASARAPIQYTVRFPDPQHNYVEVEARVPTDGRAAIGVMMAVWTPGSFLVREYAGNVEAVAASLAGRGLSIAKTTKNLWRIT